MSLKKLSAKQRVYRALYDAGPNGCTTAQLCQPGVGGVRFGARVKELRDEGNVIHSRVERAGSSRYVLDREATLDRVAIEIDGDPGEGASLFDAPPAPPRSAILDEEAA